MYRTPTRNDQCDVLDNYVKKIASTNSIDDVNIDEATQNKKTNHPAARTEETPIANTTQPNEASSELTVHQARTARRAGRFVKVAGRHDLYQEVDTQNFWKISDDKTTVTRLFDENNGVIKA